jgi:hypothetical protein
MELFTTALAPGPYGGVLWSGGPCHGELQGFVLHEMIPSNKQ